MTSLFDQIQEAAAAVSAKWPHAPTAGIILGTGLGKLTEDIQADAVIPYEAVPHFPRSTAPSHKGQLVCGTLAGERVMVMEGRFHFYEGYSLQQVTFPVRVMKALGAAAPSESRDVTLTGPDIAENGAVVPVAAACSAAGVRRIAVLVEKNPNMLAAVFDVNDAIDPAFATRVKMSQSSDVYAVALMADGRVLFTKKEIKVTLGGCGG